MCAFHLGLPCCWLGSTLETSRANWKFVFIHQLIGGTDRNGRGGVEVARFYEWGGNNPDGSYGFDEQRPGWGKRIHQLLVENHVSAVFHGHDHLFARQDLDGIVYQEVPQPDIIGCNENLPRDHGYLQGDIFCEAGHLAIRVYPSKVEVDFVRASLPSQTGSELKNGAVVFSYSMLPH